MKQKILILVKTYPTISTKYGELVCTAGVRGDGQWIRIYPVPFRLLEWDKQYKKYQYINVALRKAKGDMRPESYSPASSIETLEIIDTKDKWAARREILSSVAVHDDMEALIAAAHENKLSLAMFKPARILKFSCEKVKREWSADKIRVLEAQAKQMSLHGQNADDFVREFKRADKLPYKFSYRFADKNDNEYNMMIEDWEIGALFWNCMKGASDEKIALQKVRQKYENELPAKDMYLILGTTHENHRLRRPYPFVIVGVYHPPIEKTGQLF